MKIKTSFKKWCIQNECLDLLRFYDNANNKLDSDNISYSTSKKAYFKCEKCNLTWEKSLNKAVRKPIVSTCPYCNHRKLSPFYNFLIVYPELAEEWDYDRNTFNPSEVFPTSKKWFILNVKRDILIKVRSLIELMHIKIIIIKFFVLYV